MSARTRSVRQPRRPASRPAVTPAASPAPAPRPWTVAVIVFAGLMVVYVANFRLLGSADSIPTRLLPFSLLREGNLNLDEFSWERQLDGRLRYYVHQHDGHIYPVSPITTALVVTPLYVLPAWWLAARGIPYDDVRARVVAVVMERVSAATLTALSAALLFVVLRRLTPWRWALFLTLVYALGTSSWSIASQALWAHGLAELCLVIVCAILIGPAPSWAASIGLGLVLAVMVANRPQTVVLAAPAFLYVWWTDRRRALAVGALPLLGGILLIAYNRSIFDHVAGGYGALDHFDAPVLRGIAGLLVSPNRGLLVFTPIMLFGLWGAVQVWRVATAPPWLRWLSVSVLLHLVVHGAFTEWWAGYTYGPRYLTDVLPALTLFLVYGLVPLCRARPMQVLAAALALYGVAVQAIGVYAADDRWNRDPVPLEVQPDRVWDWSDLQILRALRNGWRGGELAAVMIDAFRDPVPARIVPLSETDLANAIATRGLPSAVRRGAMVTGTASITNRSTVGWAVFSGEGTISARYLVFLLVRWLSHGTAVAGLGDVIALPVDVAPGETVEVPLALPAPSKTGDFDLELRVTQAIDGQHGLISRDALLVPVRVD